ncbi:MAG: hypothetical protein RhofKO_28370 [Rhodothermales bacterium]
MSKSISPRTMNGSSLAALGILLFVVTTLTIQSWRDRTETASGEPVPVYEAPRPTVSTDRPQDYEGINPAQLLLQVTFDNSPLGPYDENRLEREWLGFSWANGADEGRTSIVDDAQRGRVLKVEYPSGSVGPRAGGAQWRVDLPSTRSDLFTAYYIKFDDGFVFGKGGKLPGLSGGEANSGGDRPDGSDGWSARMMWRENGEAGQYLYYPDQKTDYGDLMRYRDGSRPFRFEAGRWYRVEHRVFLNTPGQSDGRMQAWIDGQLVLNQADLRYRDTFDLGIDGFYFSTFFGGSSRDWASPKTQHIFFDDFIVAAEPITH